MAFAPVNPDDLSDCLLPIVVDLDGTLCQSDTLFESVVALLPRQPLHVARSLTALPDRAHFKKLVADRFRPDPATLPYNQALITHLREQKRRGRWLVLATAADYRIANEVAEHLGIFDEVFGSRDGVNLKAEEKRDFLVDRFGEEGFEYIGDSRADIPVWKMAANAIAIRHSPKLTRDAGRESIDLVSFDAGAATDEWRAAARALRPHQWLKNLLVFLPVLAAHKINLVDFGVALLCFIAFSAVASGAYLLNDLLDIDSDRKHNTKRHRPMASGALRPTTGLAAAAACLGCGIILAWLFLPAATTLVIVGYLAATTAYSFWLKRLLVLDLIVLSLLYAMRVLAGAVSTATPLSDWMLLFCVFFFFGLGAVKRVTEVRGLKASEGNVTAGRAYSAEDLWVLTSVAIGSGLLSVLIFALYATSDAVALLYGNPRIALLACPLLMYWISRTVILAHRGDLHDDPVVYAARDPVSLSTVLAVLGVLTLAAMA